MDYHDWRVWLPLYGSPDATLSSGALVWYDHPERTPIDQMDIKVGLLKNRYHNQFRFSVLAHVLLVAEMLAPHSPRMAALGALHDAHEAILGDQNPRQKTDAFRASEDAWSDHVHNSFGVSPPLPTEQRFVKFVDRAALIAEMEVIGHPAFEWPDGLWDAHGGRPRTLSRAPGLAAVYRNTEPDVLWSALMDIVRKGSDHEVARSSGVVVGSGRIVQPGVRPVATQLVGRDKRFVL